MGCIYSTKNAIKIPSPKDIYILTCQPTSNPTLQDLRIDIILQQTSKIQVQTQQPTSSILMISNRIRISLPEHELQLDQNRLVKKIKGFFKKCCQKGKNCILVKNPVFANQNPLLIMKIKDQIFKATVTAFIYFSIQNHSKSLKYLYFKWDEEVSELFTKNQKYFKSIVML